MDYRNRFSRLVMSLHGNLLGASFSLFTEYTFHLRGMLGEAELILARPRPDGLNSR